VKGESSEAHDYSMKTWIRVLLLATLALSSCTYYPANEYSGSGYYGPPSYYPEPNGYPGSGYSDGPPSHYSEPNGYPGPVGKWWPVVSPGKALDGADRTIGDGGNRMQRMNSVSAREIDTSGALSGNTTWALSSSEPLLKRSNCP
jgi:hypothetical protein